MRNDPVPLGTLAAAGALTQHIGVIDFANVEMRAAGSSPHLRDTPLRDQFVRGTSQQQQERVPVQRVGGAFHAENADQPFVQKARELADRRVGTRRGSPVDDQRIRMDRQRDVGQRDEPPGGGGHARQRRLDRGMRAGVEGYRPRRRLTGARELAEHHALLSGHRFEGWDQRHQRFVRTD